MNKTLTRAILLVLAFTLGSAQIVAAKGVAPTINNVCIDRSTGILRSLRTSPVKACAGNEVMVRANKVCVNKLTGKLRHLAKNVKQVCRSNEVRLVWNPSISAFTPIATGTSAPSYPQPSTPAASSATTTTVAPRTVTRTFAYKVGDVGPGGGLIFFVDLFDQYAGFTYLEAAPTDLATTAWASDSATCFDSINSATSCLEASVYQASVANASRINAAKIGQGSSNTSLINTLNSRGPLFDNSGFAAGLADAYIYGSTTDWYLPSINELGQMYSNLKAKGLGNFKDTYYWSSTEFGSRSAWYMLFSDGYFSDTAKSYPFSVRPIRSFG